MKIINDQKGFAALLLTVITVAAVFSISSGIFILNIGQQKALDGFTRSARAYYAAESGIEDALRRLSGALNWTNTYTLPVGNASTSISISDVIGGARTIISEGENAGRHRKLSITYELSTEGIGFHYGAQAGDGGIRIENGCTIDGNIYSNGPIQGSGNHTITGTAIVAKTTGYIDGAKISGDAHVETCQSSTIAGVLITNNNSGCSAAAVSGLAETIEPEELPITQEMIDNWKIEAVNGGVISGDYNLAGGSNVTLGPKKIDGNVSLTVNAIINMTGTLWITGNLSITQSSIIQLANSYSNMSGMIIVDGIMDLGNTARAVGSGVSGSYLMLVSTNSSDPAISVDNSFQGDILFALNGWINVKNSTNIREITGYGIHIRNNAGLTYEVGIANALFTQGPGGNWEVTSYREVY